MTLTPPSSNEVHLWQTPLHPDATTAATLAAVLSDDERARARRFHTGALSDRFSARRAWLRRLLGGYLDTDAAEIAFGVNDHGKPRVVRPRHSWLHFSVSHSGALTVIAVASDRQVGVDVERVAVTFPVDGVARRFLGVADREVLAGLPAGQRAAAFYTMWTRTEAQLKAIGVGLGHDDPAAPPGAHRWTVSGFDVRAGHVATVVVEGKGVVIPGSARDLSTMRT